MRMSGGKKVSTRGAQYCCVINCSNNSKTSLDARTGNTVRFFSFPSPEKERERCQKWIANIRRDDVNISSVNRKKVCSVHFEEKAFNCPTDIHLSRLLPAAVPTLITCPNPPSSFSCRRPQPQKRYVDDVPTSNRKRPAPATATSTSDVSLLHDSDHEECGVSSRKVAQKDENLREELEKTKLALANLKKENKKLKRKLKAVESGKEKLKEKHAKTVTRLRLEKETVFEKFISDPPAVPAALMKKSY